MAKRHLTIALTTFVLLFAFVYLLTQWQVRPQPISYLSNIPLTPAPTSEQVDAARRTILLDQIKKQQLKYRPLYVSRSTFNLLNLPASAVATETLSEAVIKKLPVEVQLVDPNNVKIPRIAVKAIFSSLLTVDNHYLLASEVNGRFSLYQLKAKANGYRPIEVKTPSQPQQTYEIDQNEAKIMAAAVSSALANYRFPIVYILDKTSETISTSLFPSRSLPANFMSFLRGIPAARFIPSIESVMPSWEKGPRGAGVIVFISNIHRLNERMYINLDFIGGQKRSFFKNYQIWLNKKTVILKDEATGQTGTFAVQ